MEINKTSSLSQFSIYAKETATLTSAAATMFSTQSLGIVGAFLTVATYVGTKNILKYLTGDNYQFSDRRNCGAIGAALLTAGAGAFAYGIFGPSILPW